MVQSGHRALSVPALLVGPAWGFPCPLTWHLALTPIAKIIAQDLDTGLGKAMCLCQVGVDVGMPEPHLVFVK